MVKRAVVTNALMLAPKMPARLDVYQSFASTVTMAPFAALPAGSGIMEPMEKNWVDLA
jgi:hypothetical protein